MNHKAFLARSITILLAALILAGCAAPQSTPCPTAEPQACPTSGALVLPEMNSWRKSYITHHADIRFTFNPKDQCTMEILKPATNSELIFEIVVNDQNYQNYMVSAITLDEGKTREDIETYLKEHTGKVAPPPYADIKTLDIVAPMSRTFHAVAMEASPLYFACFIQGPDDQRGIKVFEPVEIKQ